VTLAVDAASGKVMAVAVGVKPGTYVLRHRSETNFVTEVGSFAALRGIWGAEFAVAVNDAALLRTGTIELVNSDGVVVMSS
jgi:hypothetical protein